MAVRRRVAEWLGPVLAVRNGITVAGYILTTSTALTLLLFWLYEILKGGPVHPYTGIVYFLILPGFFALGLVLIPLGAWWQRRRVRARGEELPPLPKLDFTNPVYRRVLLTIGVLTVVNVVIMGTATYKGVHHMESVQFCGATCHSVMAPEFSAYQGSPHSRVACVDCHIGPGAPWFVRSKLSGVRQVLAVNLKTYSRPIPSPVQHLRPARETCEQCHWPQKFAGDKFFVRTKYADDETNTATTTVLVLKIGGRTWQGSEGIHGRHLHDTERISYVSIDGRRQVIPVVRYIDDEGKTVEYVSEEVKATPQQLAAGETRKMDCMDCHNRPTHAFDLPERAVDNAMAQGRISPQLPFVKKKAVELLRAEYSDRDTAAQRITSGLIEFYKSSHPDTYRSHRALVETAAETTKAIYLRNIFPNMKVTWGTYPNNIGHEDFLGCFRCHDGNHKSADGKVISNDCTACHTMLAMDEQNPKVLADMGLKQ